MNNPLLNLALLASTLWLSALPAAGREEPAPATELPWRQAAAAASFPARYGHSVVVFKNRLWLIAGTDFQSPRNDVWSSADGATWERVTAAAAFSPRCYTDVVVHRDKLWLIGGKEGEPSAPRSRNDVWCSEDGVKWTEVTADAGFPGRWLHQVAVYRGKIWMTCGVSDSGLKNDVWCSEDGAKWTEATPSAGFTARQMPGFVVHQDKLWIVAGADAGGNKSDVWNSPDGVTWALVAKEAGFPLRHGPGATVSGGKIWIVGGVNLPGAPDEFRTDTWSTPDGVQWTKADGANTFPGRLDPRVVALADKLWTVGGLQVVEKKPVLRSDVWNLKIGK